MLKLHKCDGCKYASEHQEMGFRPFGVCTKTTDLIEAAKAFDAKECPFHYDDNEPLQHIRISEPKIEFGTLENGNPIGRMQMKMVAHINTLNDKVICDEIIRFAKEQGFTDLFLMDKNFVESALRNEIARRQKPQTNFDKITESVESLAEFLGKTTECYLCPIHEKDGVDNCQGPTLCKDILKEWLQGKAQGNE